MGTERIIAKQYKILRRLGAGGTGTVFLCVDIRTNKKVILKILSETLVDVGHNTQRFLDEGRKGKNLKHPNIANVFDYGKDEGIYYIAMEYIDGVTIKDLIRKAKASNSFLPIPLVKKILISVLSALSYANKNGIVAHRDIKSQNIMIDSRGTVKLLDFGNAKAIGFSTYPTRWLTPEYESPEQGFPTKFGNRIDIRSDIYSLGIVMYEMLTNRLPFTGSAGEVSEKHLRAVSEDPTKFRRDLPKGIVSIMYKALEKMPSNRHQTPEEMIRDLQRGFAANYMVGTHTQARLNEATLSSRRNANSRATAGTRYGSSKNSSHAVSKSYVSPVSPKNKSVPLIIGSIISILVIITFVIAKAPHTGSSSPSAMQPASTAPSINSHYSCETGIPADTNYIYPLNSSVIYFTKDDPSSLSSQLYVRDNKNIKLIEKFPYLISCISVSGNGKYIAVVGGKNKEGYPQPVLHIFANGRDLIYATPSDLGNVTFALFKDDNEVLFTVSKSNNTSDIYLLNIKSKIITQIVSDGDENVFPCIFVDNLYYIDRTKGSELIVKNLVNGSTSGTGLYDVSAFGIAHGEILYVDRKNSDIHLANISGKDVFGNRVILTNKDNVTIVRVYPDEKGFYLLQTKNGKYWVEKINK